MHVYSSLTEKRFELLMDRVPTMRLLMRAEKSVWPHRTTYEFTAYLEYSQQFCPAGTLISNFDRSEFTLEAEDRDYLIATIVCGTTLQNCKNLVLYYPACKSGRIFK